MEPKAPLLEFEDNWGKDTETKAPDKPVQVEVPGKKDPEPEEVVVDPTPAEKKEAVDIGAGLSAEMTTSGIDGLQGIIFGLINNTKIKRRIGKDNAIRLTAILEQIAAGTKKEDLQLSADDEAMLWKLKRLRQVREDIPFTDAEYTKMNRLFEKYYQVTGQRVPPWLGLTIAIGEAIGARIADAISE